jgi:hypothetical protein
VTAGPTGQGKNEIKEKGEDAGLAAALVPGPALVAAAAARACGGYQFAVNPMRRLLRR